MSLTKQTLRDARTLLLRLLPPGNPLKVSEAVDAVRIIDALSDALAAMGNAERGRKVLEWRVRTNLAPTMNSYSYLKNFQKMNIRKKLDEALRELLLANGVTNAGHRKRWLRVTRFTPQPKTVDEAAVDSIGGKMPVDAMVRAGVFFDDRPEFMVREAHVTKTVKGNTHVLFEVFECADEAVPCGEPQDKLLPPEPKKPTKAERAAAKAAKRLATLEKFTVVPGSPVPTKAKRRKVA